jgi:hypothetical protein
MTKRVTVSPQAAVSGALRYRGVVDVHEVMDLVAEKKYYGHLRLGATKSLCSVVTARGPIYFIWHRRRKRVEHIVSQAYARQMLLDASRRWPPRRGERVDHWIVQLTQGPDEGDWVFTVLRKDGDECYSFTFPNDVELTGDYILELAWENNPRPDQCRDITFGATLLRLFREGAKYHD